MNFIKNARFLLLILMLFANVGHSKQRALVIGIDGLKSTELYRSFENNSAPHIRELAHKGVDAACPDVQSQTCARAHDGVRYKITYEWSTGPGWAAVITGLNTKKHRIKGNGHQKLAPFFEVTKKYPTMFATARAAQLRTAIGGVGAFLTSLNGNNIYPGVVDYECGLSDKGPRVNVEDETSCNATYRKALRSDSEQRDEELSEFLIKQIKHYDTDLIMGVLDQVDAAGHKFGFGDNEGYLNAIRHADELVGRIVHATRETHDTWLYVVVSDHGGHCLPLGGAHDVIFFEDEVVPFIIAVSDETPLRPLTNPRHMDVNPTVLKWLGLTHAQGIDGKVQGLKKRGLSL